MIQAHSSYMALMWFYCRSICGPAAWQITELSFLTLLLSPGKRSSMQNFFKCQTASKAWQATQRRVALWAQVWEREWKTEIKRKNYEEDGKEGYKQKQGLHTERLWMNYSLWCQINEYKSNHQDKTVSQRRRTIMSPQEKSVLIPIPLTSYITSQFLIIS